MLFDVDPILLYHKIRRRHTHKLCALILLSGCNQRALKKVIFVQWLRSFDKGVMILSQMLPSPFRAISTECKLSYVDAIVYSHLGLVGLQLFCVSWLSSSNEGI